MGGVKRPTVSAMKKRVARQEKKEKEDSSKRKTLIRTYLADRELEKKSRNIIMKMKYVTPYLLSSKTEVKLSRSRDILRKLASQGKLELLEKNGDIEIYRPITPKEVESPKAD